MLKDRAETKENSLIAKQTNEQKPAYTYMHLQAPASKE